MASLIGMTRLLPFLKSIILTESLVFRCNTKSSIEVCNDITNILNTHRNLEMRDKYLHLIGAVDCLRESGQG